MTSRNDDGLGNKPIIVIIGLIASCIAIFTFFTGWESVKDIFSSSPPSGNRNTDNTSQAPEFSPTNTTPLTTPTPTFPAMPGNWSSLGLVGEPVSDISDSQGVIYVATNGAGHGIFKSENIGQDWFAVNNGLEDFDILQVETSPENPNLVYAVDNGIWRSNDGGLTWFDANPSDDCGNDRGAAIGSNDGLTVYWRYCGGSFGISKDGGRNWQEFDCWYECYGNIIRTAPSDRTILYIFTAGDSLQMARRLAPGTNNNWLPLAEVGTGLDVYDMAISYQDSSSLFVATQNGIYKSIDDGGSWLPVNNKLPNQGRDLTCTHIKTSPWGTSEIFAVCNSQIYQTQDLGANWSLLQSPENITFVHPVTSQRILIAATKDYGVFSLPLP